MRSQAIYTNRSRSITLYLPKGLTLEQHRRAEENFQAQKQRIEAACAYYKEMELVKG